MKLNFIFAILSVLFVFDANIVSAGSTGSADIPLWSCSPYMEDWFFLSNKTPNNIDVKIKFIAKTNTSGSPNVVTDNSGNYFNATNVFNYSESTSGYTQTFTILPYESGFVLAKAGCPGVSGYGKIEWSQDVEGVTGAIVAQGIMIVGDKGSVSIPINGGKAF